MLRGDPYQSLLREEDGAGPDQHGQRRLHQLGDRPPMSSSMPTVIATSAPSGPVIAITYGISVALIVMFALALRMAYALPAGP